MKLKIPTFTSARPRAELIAGYTYGSALPYWEKITQEVREESKTLPGDPDESYPINKCTGDGPSVESAIKAVGRGGADHDKIRKHIIDSASDLGCSEQIPDNWNSDGSLKEDDESDSGALADAPEADEDEHDDAVLEAIDAAIAAQEADPDKGEPADQEVLKLLKEAKAAQEADTEEETGKPAKPQPDDKDSAGEMAADLALPGAPTPGTPDSPAAEEGGDSEDLNAPPEVPANDAIMGPAFTIPVVIIEGQPTGDGRSIAVGALDWRTPPLPLMLLATKTHDPMGMDMNAPAVMAGRIDSLERVAGEGDTAIITAKGFCLNDENGQYLASLCEQMGRLGVSADCAVAESRMEITELDEDGWPIDGNDELIKGTIMAVTACPTPAFEGAYMVLGDGSAIPDAIPQQSEHEPVVASAHFMTYSECEPCQEGLEVMVASGAPARPPRAWFEDPLFTPGDGRLQQILSTDGEEQWACPLTVTEDGRVFGHIAPWGVCHTGKPGCVTAPPSPSGYALFMRGSLVTAEGEKIRVGTITADTNHAPTSGVTSVAAIGHYDNTAFAAADVVAGEDDYGIWVAGALRPGASEAQKRKLTAGSISGDWRRFGGELDLIAALAVPMPGFPIAVVDHGERQAIVASGARIMHAIKHPDAQTHDHAFAPSTARALERLAARDARERIEALR